MGDREVLRMVDKYRMARYAYRIGLSYMEDSEYDTIESELKRVGVQLAELDRTYDEDDIDYALIERMGFDPGLFELQRKADTGDEGHAYYYNTLCARESLSIRSVTEYREAYVWMEQFDGVEMDASLKVDGLNTATLYEEDTDSGCMRYRATVSRGRAQTADPIDFTNNTSRILPRAFPTPGKGGGEITFTAEAYVPAGEVEAVAAILGKGLSTPRGAAMSLLRVQEYPDYAYRHLHMAVFRCSHGRTLLDGRRFAEGVGLETVPSETFLYRHRDFEYFCSWADELLARVKGRGDGADISADGVVLSVNDNTAFEAGRVKNQYHSHNLAFKIGLWKPGHYRSKVVDFEIMQRDVSCNCMAIVEPVKSLHTNKTLTRVNLFNPALLFSQGIKVGDEIEFVYKNDTTIDLVYGDKYK